MQGGHRYTIKTVLVPYFSTFGFFAVSSWGIYNGTTSPALSHLFGAMPIIVRVILFAAPLAGLAAFIGTVLIFRPIAIDENGIMTFLFGRVFKSIVWSKVQRIEKCRSYDSLNERYQFVYFVRAPKRTVRFQEGLNNPEELVDGINQYIEKFAIETILVDRGGDTIAHVMATIEDPLKRRELRKFGLRKRIARL